MTAALTASVDLLAALGEQPPLQLGPPTGDDWWTLDEATARASEWLPDLVAMEGDRRAAATYLATWLAEAPILTVGLCAVLGGAAPVVARDGLWLHRHSDGWFDRHAVDPVEVHTGPEAEMLDVEGVHVAELTAPVVDAVCADMPVGPVAVWGSVADAIGGHALHAARELGIDELATWRRCQLLVDSVAREAPQLRHRPHLFPVSWSGGTAHYQVRGTCCLYHRTCDRPDPDGDGYCVTCPLRTDDSRTRRLRRHLETLT